MEPNENEHELRAEANRLREKRKALAQKRDDILKRSDAALARGEWSVRESYTNELNDLNKAIGCIDDNIANIQGKYLNYGDSHVPKQESKGCLIFLLIPISGLLWWMMEKSIFL